MKNQQKIYISGVSAITASGLTADDTFNSLQQGRTSLKPIESWDISPFACQLGGELSGFVPAKQLPDKKLVKVISTQDAYGIAAACQAVEDSSIIAHRDALSDATLFNDRTAVFVGSPGNKYIQQYDFLPLVHQYGKDFKGFAEHLFEVVHPMWLLRILPNNVLAYTGITYGFKGVNHNVSNHAVSGMQALIEAFHALRNGEADRAVVVAYDLALEPQGIYHYEKLGVLSNTALSPFDKSHNGTVLGDGAAALVIETEESLNARGAKPYAEIKGGFSATEGQNLFSIDKSGQPLKHLLDKTCAELNILPSEISAVIAHANGNPLSDESEATAIQAQFGKVPVTGFKWSMGHTLAASGILDTVLGCKSLSHQSLPGIANFNAIATECQGLNVIKDAKSLDTSSKLMIINRGFAGMNACLVLAGCA